MYFRAELRDAGSLPHRMHRIGEQHDGGIERGRARFAQRQSGVDLARGSEQADEGIEYVQPGAGQSAFDCGASSPRSGLRGNSEVANP